MARKPYLEEPDQPDRWLVSYADFITLLFALFVVMYAMASMPGMQFRQLSSSLGEALGSKVSAPTAGPAIDAVPILHMDSP
ncbi:MAG: flagellar motor protein MotD, partial [Pseudomonadota bacterium]